MKLLTLLTLVADQPVRRQRLAMEALVGHEAEVQFAGFEQRAAEAWQRDMAPVLDVVVSALKAGDMISLRKLREVLPGLLSQVNEAPALATVLMRQMFREFAAGLDEQSPVQSADAPPTASMQQWRGRSLFPTDLSSADLRGLSSELHLRSVFSARTTNADYLQEVASVVDQVLSGEINMATWRWHLMKKLAQLGYDPETGFPQDMANVPPAEKGSLRDLSSKQRLDLMLKTNVSVARNYGRVVEGNSEAARFSFPAWELVRIGRRETPRGTPDSHSVGWQLRWTDAGNAVNWEGASKSVMIALKDSPIWQALGDGAGGYEDTLGHPFPPFAFNSGMGWVAVAREDVESLGLSVESGEMVATLSPSKAEARAALDRISPDFRASLLKELEDLAA